MGKIMQQTARLSIEVNTGDTEKRLKSFEKQMSQIEKSGIRMAGILKGLPIHQSFKAASDSIKKMGDSANNGSTNIQKLQKQLLQAQLKSDKLARSVEKSNTQVAKLGRAFAITKAKNDKLTAGLAKANAKIDEMTKKMQKAERETQKAKNAVAGFGAVSDKLKSLAGFTMFGMGVADILRTADTMKTLDTQIKLVTKSEQEHAAVKANLSNIANKTRQDIGSTIEAYTNNARSLGQLGKNQAQVLKFTENISLAMAVGGKSAQEQSAALLQLGQAMQSGVLQGDEFRSIAENSPILLDLIAQKLGKTREEVKKLASDGKITSEVIYQSVIGAGDQLNKQFATMPATMSQALTLVNNRYQQFVDNFMNKSGGLGEQIAKSLIWVSDNFNTLSNTMMGLGVVYGGYMALNSKFATKTIPTKIAALSASTKAFYAESVAVNANTAAKIRNDGVLKTLSGTLQATRVGQFTQSLAGATLELGRGTGRMLGYANEARKTNGVLGAFRLGVTNATTAVFNKNRAIGVLNATKGLLIGTAGRLGGVMTTLGRAILGVGAIIKAHPIMFIAGIITTVITATMGLENAMKSFGDAVGIAGLMVKDFVKWAVDGIGNQMTKAIDFMAGFFGSKSKDGTNKASNAFKDFFKTSEGGFVGMLRIIARVFDKIVSYAKSSMIYASSYVNDMVISVKNAYNSMMPSWMGGGGEQQAQRNMSFADALEQGSSHYFENQFIVYKTAFEVQRKEQDRALQGELGALSDSAGSAAKALKETEKAAKGKDVKDTKATKQQGRLVGISGNTGIGTGAHLDIRISGGSRRLTEAELARFQAGGKELSAWRKTSEYGKRKAPTKGASTFHRGIDYAMPVGTAITTHHAVQDVKTFFDNKGGGWVSRIEFADGLSVDLLHQSEAVQKVQKGSSAKTGDALGGAVADLNNKLRDDEQRRLEEQKKAQESLLKQYGTWSYRQAEQLKEEIIAINNAFGESSETAKKLTAIASERYAISDKLRQQEQQLEMYSHKMTTTERMALEHEIHQLKISLNDEYTEAERTAYKDAVSEKYKHDLEMFKKLQDEKVKEINDPIIQALDDQAVLTTKRLNKNSMRPDDYRRWELSQEIAAAKNSSERSYEDRVQAIEKKDSDGRYEIESEKERQRLLEEAHRLHKETLANIDAEYGEKSKLLNDELLSAKLQSYGSAAGALAGLFRDMSGEQSKAYRAMFAVSKAFSIANIGIKMGSAIADAWSDPSATTIWQKMANAARVAVEQGHLVSMINAINPKGFKTGGYTGNIGVNSVAGVVHGQEYVMNAKATKRIGVNNLERLSNGEGIGGNTTINVNVTVNSDGSNVQADNQIGKRFGEAIKAAVQKELHKERRQGGLLYGA